MSLGVDLGGTKIEAALVRLGDEPEVLVRKRVPTQAEHGYTHIVQRIHTLILDVAREGGVALDELPIGVGMPGSFARTEAGLLVKNSNTTCLNGRPFQDDLNAALGRPLAYANDANCFALAESIWGAARGAEVVFGVILGTGVGGGVVFRGEIWPGAQGIAGEWGHMVLDPVHGRPCYCGKRGCVETYLAGPALEAAYAERRGARMALREIAADPRGREILVERMDWFGRALANVIDVLDPNVVVLGGGASNLGVWYTEGVDAVRRWVFNDALHTRIVQHSLGDSAGVLGAALLGRAAHK